MCAALIYWIKTIHFLTPTDEVSKAIADTLLGSIKLESADIPKWTEIITDKLAIKHLVGRTILAVYELKKSSSVRDEKHAAELLQAKGYTVSETVRKTKDALRLAIHRTDPSPLTKGSLEMNGLIGSVCPDYDYDCMMG